MRRYLLVRFDAGGAAAFREFAKLEPLLFQHRVHLLRVTHSPSNQSASIRLGFQPEAKQLLLRVFPRSSRLRRDW